MLNKNGGEIIRRSERRGKTVAKVPVKTVAGSALGPTSRAGQFKEMGPRNGPSEADPLAPIVGKYGGESWDNLKDRLKQNRASEE